MNPSKELSDAFDRVMDAFPSTGFISHVVFPSGFPDYAPALIGHTKPKHPRIFALIRAFSNRVNKIIVEEEHDEYGAGSFGSYGDSGVPLWHIALDRLRIRLWRLTAGWESQPIYDEAKRAEIKAAFDAKRPKTMTWGRSYPFNAFHASDSPEWVERKPKVSE